MSVYTLEYRAQIRCMVKGFERRDREKLGKPEISIEVWFKFKVTIRFKVKVRVRFKVRIKFKGKVRVRNKFKFNSFCVG